MCSITDIEHILLIDIANYMREREHKHTHSHKYSLMFSSYNINLIVDECNGILVVPTSRYFEFMKGVHTRACVCVWGGVIFCLMAYQLLWNI